MSEELGVRIAVEGLSDFNRAFEAMNGKIDDTADALGGISKPADSAGQAFDKNVAQSNKLKLAMMELAATEAKLATETDALKRAQLEVKADSLREQISKLNQTTSDGVAQTKKFKLSLTDLKSGIDLAVSAAKTAAAAFQEAFNFLKEGAGILQARESVKMLGIDLEELRAAAGGTVSDMDLISSAAKLLAGTTGELNKRMAEAAPQLLEVARAAVKLDPTIGSVAFVYESLAKGIKKNQPLLIDNANIVVKVGQANEELAAKLGKTVAQLTDEEKSMALLEATLKGGANMIEQMGGKIDSATDSYAILEVQVKNATDLIKAQAAEIAGPTVSAWATHYQALDKLDKKLFTIGNLFDSVRLFITGTSGAVEEMNRQLAATEFIDKYASSMQNAKAAMIETANAESELSTLTLGSQESWDQYTMAIQMAEESTIAQNHALVEAQENVLATDAAVSLYKAGLSGAVGNEMAAFSGKQSELTAKGEELRAKISELEQKKYLTEAQKGELAALREELGKNSAAIDESAAAHEKATARILLSFAEQRLGMDGLTAAELLALQSMATEWGLMDQETLTAIKSIDRYATGVENGTLSMDGFIAKAGGLKESLLAIPTNINVRVKITTEGSIPSLPSGPEGKGVAAAYQHGGTPTGGNIIVGEGGRREMLTGVPSSARVLSNATTERIISQNNATTNQYNLTTQSMVRPGGLALEFASMEMGSR